MSAAPTRLLSTDPCAPLGKLLRLPLCLLPRQSVLPILSGINKGYQWRVGSHTHGCWIGTYEREKQDACARLVRRGMAVSEQRGIVDFRIAESNAMGSITDEPGAYRVCSIALDELIERSVLPPPDLVKMDVEGSESRVLRGAARLLSQRRAIWLVVLHGQQQWQECRKILHEHGYSIFRIDGMQVATASEMVDEVYALPEEVRLR